ncbi:hypothetical protein [Pectinatus frisingensis]|uniref:hypothetical protein n=1 Tax=Pectinatus frisingensis TaxID=865 RepID=UPI0018C5053F|nr:hypothetical protein [Pectinatus frisingensis]
MNKPCGYLRTIQQYLHTPKGQHDCLDYLRAILFMLIIMLVIYFLLKSLAGAFQ